MKEIYLETLKSGMFFEFFPELSGNWEQDKLKFIKMYFKNNLNQSVNYKGIKINILDVSIENGISVSIEEGEKTFEFPRDSSFDEEYSGSNKMELFFAHDSILDEIGSWAQKERAANISETMKDLVYLAMIVNKGNKTFSIGLNFDSKIGSLSVIVYQENKVSKIWNCHYLGANAFKSVEGFTHIAEVENKLVEYLKTK